ncbi:hypothetical protein SAMN06297251_10511 [Fulvimarina manganoxydans]|uniref:Uncharacterized protein n=1 Tax=Fulvimarina manganoxydans TaxID=937218 RepID=A0A1W2AQJ1_9HYPH|nr:hypothetical protein [Fulvimarina manganoxydans]SMC62967.1 hypothetical protein SAMN06297251_10511 [Fulvimarina manganoxydans]
MPDPERPKRRYTRLSDEEWASAREEWASGEVTLAELADRTGASVRALQLHFDAHDVTKGSAAREKLAAYAQVPLPPVPSCEDDPATNAKLVKETALRGACEVEAGILEQIAIARADPTLAYRAGSAIKALAAAADALGKIHTLKRAVLGLDEIAGAEMPVLTLRVLTDEEVTQMRDAQEAEDEDLGMVDVEDDVMTLA